MMADKFANFVKGLESPAVNFFDIVPSDTAPLPNITRGIWIGGTGSGNLKIAGPTGNTVTFTAVSAGTLLPIRISTVFATGTTVTNLIGLY